MRTLRTTCFLVFSIPLFTIVACGSDSDPGTGADTGVEDAANVDTGGGTDLIEDSGTGDAGSSETGDDSGGELRDFGETCVSNEDCASGFCVAGRTGFVCTVLCGEGCPELDGEPMSCRTVTNFGADDVRVCVPLRSGVCEPCLDDRNCLDGACVTLPDGSQVCGSDCPEEIECPAGTFCFSSVPGSGELEAAQCLPNNLTCDCTDENADETRPCARSNESGTRTCTGMETCDATRGWVGCDAPAPQPEECNGDDDDCNGVADDGILVGEECEVGAEGMETTCIGVTMCRGSSGIVCVGQTPTAEVCDLRDNDCNDEVDELFRDSEDRYVDNENCGVCGNSCSDRYPDGYESECQLVEDEPLCVVTQCPPSYAHSGLTACIPLDSYLCFECETDVDCNEAVGDQCVTYTGGARFCGRDCGSESVFGELCPEDYVCDPTLKQCMVLDGTCVCGPSALFYLPCVIEGEGEARCVGTQLCDYGELWTCIPPDEVCDAVDNNCDGHVDEGFVNAGTGEYDSDAHCGRCNNDCRPMFGYPDLHADGGVCEDVEGRMTCAPSCTGSYRNADGRMFNGCECELLGDEDEPDALGLDANCDGIDGVVARGVFVAKHGDDDTGTGDITAPFATIGAALDVAAHDGRDHVYVSAGVYRENVHLVAGVSMFGGYSPDFFDRDVTGNETAIIAVAPRPAEDQRGAINCLDISEHSLVVAGFSVFGFDQSETSESSYAIHMKGCTDAVTIRDNVVHGGDGGNGGATENGSPGEDAAAGSTGFSAAEAGRGGRLTSGTCSTETVAGGDGARFSCPDYDGADGNTHGGDGATSDCPHNANPEATGESGTDTPGVSAEDPMTQGGNGGLGGYSYVGADQFGCVCFVPDGEIETSTGLDGRHGARGAMGAAGMGCANTVGRVAGSEWVPDGSGSAGGRGGPGSGGGGGGAGGGMVLQVAGVCGPEEVGGSGGGGGAGGCGGEGGGGGKPGGGSFAFLVIHDHESAPPPIITGNTIHRGRGGGGGDGGAGGDGGIGSDGAPGTDDSISCTAIGGNGGDGGPGGPGGGGGGGCGGISVGIYTSGVVAGVRTSYGTDNSFSDSGGGGDLGRGGPSAGNPGSNARDPIHEVVLPCPTGDAPPCGGE